jgi:hypothetical protein
MLSLYTYTFLATAEEVLIYPLKLFCRNIYNFPTNPHLTQEVPLHLVKVGVWCAVSARKIVGPVFFNETIKWERYVQIILGQFNPELTE